MTDKPPSIDPFIHRQASLHPSKPFLTHPSGISCPFCLSWASSLTAASSPWKFSSSRQVPCCFILSVPSHELEVPWGRQVDGECRIHPEQGHNVDRYGKSISHATGKTRGRQGAYPASNPTPSRSRDRLMLVSLTFLTCGDRMSDHRISGRRTSV